jgi:hypothetical protein
MSTDLTLPKGFGPVPAAFAASAGTPNDDLAGGVASSYAVMGYRGKVWSMKYQGTEEPLMRDDGDGPRNSVEVVLVKASPQISKIFYASGYVDGSTAAPDCWSGNGVTPDASVQVKQHATCADCPMNAWGSRITEAGKQGKACADSRRMAVVPVADMANEAYGGPILLRVPAASLKDLKAYGDFLNGYQFPYYAVVTKVSFDAKEAFPKFVFSAVRPLTEDEAAFIKDLRDDKRVSTVLAERNDAPVAGAAVAAVPKSPFEQDAGEPAAPSLSEQAAAKAPAPKPAAPKAAAKPAAPKPAAPKAAAAQPAATQAATPEQKAAAAKLAAARAAAALAAAEAEAAEAEAAATAAPVEEEQLTMFSGEVMGDGGEEGSAVDDFEAALESVLKGD